VFDYVLNGQYPNAADIAATRLGQSTVPIGPPRAIGDVPLPGVTIDGSTASLTPLTPVAAAASAVGTAASAPPVPASAVHAVVLRGAVKPKPGSPR